MNYPPQTAPVCCRCGQDVYDNTAVPVVLDHQTKQVCSTCATPAEKAAANPQQKEESR